MNDHKYYLTKASYRSMYKQSIDDPNSFWSKQAHRFIDWISPWTQVKTGDFSDAEWFLEAKLNACYNCVDRHLQNKADEIALLWEGDSAEDIRRITYRELHQAVCQFANLLKKYGLKKGDPVCIYLPMIPEAAYAMLACTRIGAIHSVVFAGFSPDSLQTRILDIKARFVVTADEGLRGGKIVPLKKNVDKVLNACPSVEKVVVVKRTNNPIPWQDERDLCYDTAIQQVMTDCPIEVMDANDPLFILYTSGSTGKPKGIVHATGGYLVYAATTYHYIFNYHPGDVYWCSADIGWITGHTYLIYGPLLKGATTFMYEGTPQYPSYARYWEIIDRHQVNIFYTSPTVLRALRKQGDDWLSKSSRASLQLLGTVGEPIAPDVWHWFHEVVGKNRCPIVDTWWQTETGGVLITPVPGVQPLKAGSAGWPFFGIKPAIVDEAGALVAQGKSGQLVIQAPWPGMMRTIYGDEQRFIESYFKKIPGKYLTGDVAREDTDGYYWISGRDDDIIKVSGHRLGTGELESAFLQHPAVSEAAVVAIPHEITGQAIYAYVSLKQSVFSSEELKVELIQHVRATIGPLATPQTIQWVRDLPKTRSGKIIRRILRQVATNELDNLGDMSTLADPEVMGSILTERKKG